MARNRLRGWHPVVSHKDDFASSILASATVEKDLTAVVVSELAYPNQGKPCRHTWAWLTLGCMQHDYLHVVGYGCHKCPAQWFLESDWRTKACRDYDNDVVMQDWLKEFAMCKCHYCDNEATKTLVWLKNKKQEPARIKLPWCGCDLQVALQRFWPSPYKVVEGVDYEIEPPKAP